MSRSADDDQAHHYEAEDRIGRRVINLSHKADQNPGIQARMRETKGTRFRLPIETDVLNLGV